MARTIRQREDDKSKWDVLEEGPDGRPNVSIVDTVTAARMQKAGDVITSGEEWGDAYKAAEERAGILKRGGAGAPGMVHALDENDEPVVASLDTVRKRGWEVVTPETAARAGEAFMASRQPPEVAVSNGKAAPATVQPFRRMSPEEAQAAEQDVRAFQAGLPTAAPVAPRAASVRPMVDVQRAEAAEPMRGFQPLAQFAPAMRTEGEGQAMQAPTSAPPAQAGDEEFAAAQAEARARRTAAGIGRAGAMLNQAISGAGYDPSVYGEFADAADLPVKELLARREADKRKALEDPTSDASRRLQVAVSKALPGVYSPEELALISAADEGTVMKYGEMRQRLDQRAAERTREDALRTAGLAREDTLRANERTYREKQAGSERAFQAGEAAKQRAFQREMAGLNNAADLAQAQARSGMGANGVRLQERNVGGYTFDPANPPSATAAKTMADVSIAKDTINASLAQMEALFDRVGTEVLPTEERSLMESAWKDVTDQVRTIGNMGVPNGADYVMLAKQIPQPFGMAGARTPNSAIKAKFGELRRQIEQRVNSTAKALKFTPQEQQISPAPRRLSMPDGSTWEEGSDGQMRRVN